MTLSLVDINVGLTANDGSGDSLRVGGQKANQNFAVLRGQREVLASDRTYYVSPSGNDGNDGRSPAGAFQTIQHAFDVIYGSIDLGRGYTANIQLADGTYLGANTLGALAAGATQTGAGMVVVNGNAATPSNVVVNNPPAGGNDTFAFFGNFHAEIRNLKIRNSHANGDGIHASSGAVIGFTNIVFDSVQANHLDADAAATIYGYGNYSIVAGGVAHFVATLNGLIQIFVDTVTITGTPVFSEFVQANTCGIVQLFSGTFSGAISGAKYVVFENAVVENFGVVLPGTGSSLFSGGVYGGRTQREILGSARTYYVSPTGNDNNDGSAGSPFLTIQHAVDLTLFGLDTNGNNVVIQLADGTYDLAGNTIGVYLPPLGGGSVYIRGNIATPANVVVKTTDNYVFDVEEFADIRIEGMELQCLGAGGWACVAAFNQSIVRLSNIRFGNSPSSDHILSAGFSIILITGNYSIVGSGNFHYNVTDNGSISIFSNLTITLTGTPAFSYFAYVELNSFLLLGTGTVYSGAATGIRYHVDINSSIFADGHTSLTYLPGNVNGEIVEGGVYHHPTSFQAFNMALANGANNNITLGVQEFNRITGPTGAFSISGFDAVGVGDGRKLSVFNSTAQNMTITNDATSTASNRILTLTGADVALTGTSIAHFIYSLSDSRWILAGTQG
jgi:hypothetical protein